MIELYTDANPNGLKVSIGLEEMGLQYNVHRVFLGGDQVTPERGLALVPSAQTSQSPPLC
jgi:glutathione S-transferase